MSHVIHTAPLDGPVHSLAFGFVIVALGLVEEEIVALKRGLAEIGPVVVSQSLAVQLDPAALLVLLIDLVAFGALVFALLMHLPGLWLCPAYLLRL